ncbi:MAG: DUF2851 family protein [Caldithrix sp.]|nr:DUF2851 family protein [Caldithrix sp.]
MQEENLYRWWEYYARIGNRLHLGGRTLRILDSGRFSPIRGPDFKGALFELDGIRMQGDVEMHITAEDWYRHEHHLDREFGNVMLHISGRSGKEDATTVYHQMLPQSIPDLVLPVPDAAGEHAVHLCRAGISYAQNLPDRLKQLAVERFNRKVHQFAHDLRRRNVEAVFYEYFMRVLGYPHNGAAFQMLSRRLPSNWLAQWLPKFWLNAEQLYAVYAGLASFLSSSASEKQVKQLRDIFRKWRTHLPFAPMDAALWQFNGNRVANHPHFRLAGWVAFLQQYHYHPLHMFHELLAARKDPAIAIGEIHGFLNLPVEGYWQRHYALGKILNPGKNLVYWGKDRQLEIIINLILPFFTARAILNNSEGFADYLTDLFLSIPLNSTYRSVLKNVTWKQDCLQALNRQAVLQALIELENTYCRPMLCCHCPIGRRP